MTDDLTKRQRDILGFIESEAARRGIPPTVREIAAQFGISSPNGVQGHLKALRQKGYLNHEPGISRGIRLARSSEKKRAAGASGPGPRHHEFPLAGEVAAGGPRLAVTSEGEGVTLEDASGARPGDFFLTVKGDSMTGSGINPGDIAVVRPDAEVKRGEIAVVMVGDEEATIKRYYREKDGSVRLVPDNPDYAPITVDPKDTPVTVAGKVVGVIRRY